MLLCGITLVVVSVAWLSITCAKMKVAPEVVNDVNPGIPFINHNRFNPALTRPKMLGVILLVLSIFLILVCSIVYKIFSLTTLIEILTPTGLLVNFWALISLLSSILFPIAIYSTNEDARNHLRGLINKILTIQLPS